MAKLLLTFDSYNVGAILNRHFTLTSNTKLISITQVLTASHLYKVTEAYVWCCKLHYLYSRTFTPTETQQPTLTSQLYAINITDHLPNHPTYSMQNIMSFN
jgi:hypothetical protein